MIFLGTRTGTPCAERSLPEENDEQKENPPITKRLALLVAVLLVGGASVTPVGANMLRSKISGFTAVDPGALAMLGVAMVSVGAWTRRKLLSRGGRSV